MSTPWKTDTHGLSSATLAAGTELRVIDDPTGTPTSKKTTAGAIATFVAAQGTAISALSAASALDGTEPWAVVQGGNTVKAIGSQLLTYVNANASLVAARLSATAQYVLFGRSSSGSGAGQEIATSANVFTMLGSANNAAICSNIGALNFNAPISGQWFNAFPQGRSSGSNAGVANYIFFNLTYFPVAFTLNSVAIRVTTNSAATNVGIALYPPNATTGRPTSTPTAKTGNISCAATGNITSTMTNGNIAIPAGWYWVAVAYSSAAPQYLVLTGDALTQMSIWPGAATLANVLNTGGNLTYSIAYNRGSFDTTNWPDVTGVTFVEWQDGGGTCPIVALKVN